MSAIQFSLPEGIVISTVLEQQNLFNEQLNLLEAQGQNTQLEINIDALVQIDTAGIQLLYSFIEALKKKGHSHSWQGSSDIFSNSVKTLGMQAVLQVS